MILNILLASVLALIVTCIYVLKKSYQYWSKKCVPQIEPTFPFGSFLEMLSESEATVCANAYKHFKRSGSKHGGLYVFTNPIYIPADAELVKSVLIKDFNHFVNHQSYHNERDDPVSAHLFSIEDDIWKNLRIKLAPTFTSGKMKMMFPAVVKCSGELTEALGKLEDEKKSVDIKDLAERFTMDVIGRCVFGIECQTLSNQESDFSRYGHAVNVYSMIRTMRYVFCRNFPRLGRALRLHIYPKDVSKFFSKFIADNVAYRERNNVRRDDFFQLLLDIKNPSNKTTGEEKGISDKVFNATAFEFFAAGFETSSTLMSYALFELAQHQDIQQKLRGEIVEVLQQTGGSITYEALNDMKYLDKVVKEVLRKHPIVSTLTRMCTKDYKVPGSNVTIDKGVAVFISVLGIHYDEEFYPNPDVLDPERFNEENKAKRPSCTFLPFGEGPRNCIGLRFGMLQAKCGLIEVLRNFLVSLNEKTELPLRRGKSGIAQTITSDVYLNISKI